MNNSTTYRKAVILLAAALGAHTALAQSPIEPRAGTWKTWILRSGAELRLPAVDRAETVNELAWLKSFMSSADANARDQVAFWDAGSPPMRWIEMVNTRLADGWLTLPAAWRAYALLSVAMHDGMVAAWDSKYAHNRPRPSAVDSSIVPLLAVPKSPAYPAEHAVAAGAAAVVLASLLPDEATLSNALAEEAAQSRLYAGLQDPSDVIAGLELGRAVGRKVMEYAVTDGFSTPWTGTVPTGPGMWVGSNPVFANAPGWKPFVLSSASEFRPPPPPAHDSAETKAELAEMKSGPGPFLNAAKAMFRQTPEGNISWFFNELTKRLFEYRLDGNPPRDPRAYALLAVTTWDQIIASHDAKMLYFWIRPSQLDTTVPLLFSSPNHPSYPANHALTAAQANLLGYLFPREADYYRLIGQETGLSQIWTGIHYRSDVEPGWEMARKLLQRVVERAEFDGSNESPSK